MQRREFLGGILGFVLISPFSRGLWAEEYNFLLLPTKDQHGLAQIDLNDFDSHKWTQLDYRPHALVKLPENKVIVLPKDPLNRALILSTRTLKIVGDIKASKGKKLFGHGSISPDGKTLALIESRTDGDLKEADTKLIVFDLKDNLKRLKEVSIGTLTPHDVIWINSNELILNQRLDGYGVTNIEEGHAFKLNLKTGKLLPWIQAKKGMSIGHFYLNKKDIYLVEVALQEQKFVPTFAQVKGDKLKYLNLTNPSKANAKHGALHVAFDNVHKHAGVTFPWEGAVRAFDLKMNQQMAQYSFDLSDAPLAIEYFSKQNCFYVFATSGKIFKWDIAKGQMDNVYKLNNASAESHIYWWNLG